jgi:hypothetical protein
MIPDLMLLALDARGLQPISLMNTQPALPLRIAIVGAAGPALAAAVHAVQATR